MPSDENINLSSNQHSTVVHKTKGDQMGQTTDAISFGPNETDSSITGYPKSEQALYEMNDPNPPHESIDGGYRLKPGDHFKIRTEPKPIQSENVKFFVSDAGKHFIRDTVQHNQSNELDNPMVNPKYPTNPVTFSGAVTHINPTNNPETANILDAGSLSKYLEDNTYSEEDQTIVKPPTTPIHPFFRMNDILDPNLADTALYNSYNRTRIPVADIEWRKGFRYIFFTRPECYLMYRSKGDRALCEQAFYDEDFQSAWTRVPHIIRMLSPWYVSGSFPEKPTDSNWNMLLSNRVLGLNVQPSTLSYNENVSKSIEGFTIMPGANVESRQGSTLELSFNDTKRLDVYELARLWMLYIYKRKKGIFIPPYNGYKFRNNFLNVPAPSSDGDEKKIAGIQMSSRDHDGAVNPYYTRYHPYDRALEYCASLYDIITNETGTKILYWCKYYGIYPTSVSPNLSNDKNEPITEMKTNITFKYHYRLENTNKILVEFNHDAGLTDDIGRIKEGTVSDSLPFLLRNDYSNSVLKQYIGPAGMFTGSPYIVMMTTRGDPLHDDTRIVEPNLRFMNLEDFRMDNKINLGLKNVNDNPNRNRVASY